MKDYSAMTDVEINMQVSVSLYGDSSPIFHIGIESGHVDYCGNPTYAWPIIEENDISIINDHPGLRIATSSVNSLMNEIDSEYYFQSAHENGLRAAMICYLMMKDAEKCDG